MLSINSPTASPLTTVLVWTLRLCIPVLLVWTYYKFQQQKFHPKLFPSADTHKYVYSRNFLIHAKSRAMGNSEERHCPELPRLVTEVEAPNLFLKPEKKSRGNRKQRTHERDENEVPANTDEKMHLESLVNYVAFNRAEQRNFHPECPPPPPRTADARAPEGGNCISPEFTQISSESMELANQEAQMLLQAAVTFNRGAIAMDLWKQLSTANIEVTSKTFSLLIEACLTAKDLKGASDFVIKMEANGHCPAELLNKVMELYAVQTALQKSDEDTTMVCGSAPPATCASQLFAESEPEWEKERKSKHAKRKAKRYGDSEEKMSPDAPVFVPQGLELLAATITAPTNSNGRAAGTLNAEAVPFQPMQRSYTC